MSFGLPTSPRRVRRAGVSGVNANMIPERSRQCEPQIAPICAAIRPSGFLCITSRVSLSAVTGVRRADNSASTSANCAAFRVSIRSVCRLLIPYTVHVLRDHVPLHQDRIPGDVAGVDLHVARQVSASGEQCSCSR